MTFEDDRETAVAPGASGVMAAMSGGVDSSVCALLLQEAGFDVRGATMVLRDDQESTCGSSRDVEDARAVCQRLGIPHDAFDLRDRFDAAVVRPFCDAYLEGRTPNPCIACNRFLKFESLQQRRRELGFDYVATGHYARRRWDAATGRWQLLRACDPAKDQSYVLYHLTQDTLAHMLFPLGELTKGEVRELARARGFVTAAKPESQDICFVPDGDYVSFLRDYGHVELTPGDFVDREGRVLGRHKGLPCYTTGQRKGLGVSAGKHVYVVRKNAADNTILLGDNADLFTDTLTARDVNWISGETPPTPVRCTAKTRYSQTEAACTAAPLPDGRLRVTFDEPQRAVTAGQAVVLYDGEEVLGGGTIE